jgi:coiled-coil domain-containing protein 55
MSFKFGLNVKNKLATGPAKSTAKSKLGKRKPLFDDEEEVVKAKPADAAQEIGEFSFEDTLATTSASSKPAPKKAKKGQPISAPPPPRKPKARNDDDPTAPENSASTKEAERRAQEALEGNAKLYDYDAAYDALHARTAAKKAAEQEDVRRPKYMDSLFESAEQRKKDRLRAQDKLLQREREAEGDEYADKEKFVTGAYKAQQEETRRAEEEEKKRQEAEDEKRKKSGMQSFHKQMLMEQEKRHQEAMEAAAEASKEGYIAPVQEEENEETDAELVEKLRKQGKIVSLNEEGQVTDKRQLLSAGLNIVAKPRPVSTPTASSARPANAQTGYQAPKAGRNAQRQRQTEMVVQQIEAAAKRKADEEAEEQAKIQQASKSQKTSADIMGAKERYLQRKKEAAAAKAGAGK